MIRPQYHFRRVGGDTFIWDVRKLIDRVRDGPVVDWPLARIAEIDEPYWGDSGATLTCRAVLEHADLIAAADLDDPILFCAEGRVMDGMHRVMKAVREGRETIPARQISPTPPPDFKNVDADDLPY